MAPTPELAYAQARIQARHGERLGEADWRRLESARSAAQFLALARNTSITAWAARVAPDMEPHVIERGLQAAWRDTVDEVAGWLPAEWRDAVRCYGVLPELPIRDHLARGLPPPAWFERDERLRPLADKTAKEPGELAVGAEWLARWHACLPPLPRGEAKALQALAARFFACFNIAERATRDSPCRPSRSALEAICIRAFRRHAGSPVAVFAHLLLALLDFERFRGELLARKLFATPDQRSAA